jgi:hypothetical protein
MIDGIDTRRKFINLITLSINLINNELRDGIKFDNFTMDIFDDMTFPRRQFRADTFAYAIFARNTSAPDIYAQAKMRVRVQVMTRVRVWAMTRMRVRV